MLANIDPIWSRVGRDGFVRVTAANTSSQGGGTIGTDIFLAFTTDGTNGSLIRFLRWIATATTPTTTTATIGRVFISTQSSGATTNANTYPWAEVSLPAVAADNASTSVFPIDVPLNVALGINKNILVTNHAAPAANTAWVAIAICGDY
jgi:hypothetical protein